MKQVNIGSDRVEAVKRAHPKINWRHQIHQTTRATGFDELNFSPENVVPLIEGGKQDAKTALAALDSKLADEIA